MRTPLLLFALPLSLLWVPSSSALSEYGIEGMGVVSTRGNEVRASLSADGQRIVWASNDRADGAGGWDLWQAQLRDGRWQDPQPLAVNTPADEFDPFFSPEGQWLYFASNRRGGQGGTDLYRAPVLANGGYGAVQSLGKDINSRGDERAPSVNLDSRRLLFASNGHGGAGGFDLFTARWNDAAFGAVTAVPGINTAADEFDGAWLGEGRAIVFARATARLQGPSQLWLAQCEQGRYAAASVLTLSFNTADAHTRGPVLDASKPGELLVSGSARAPKAGQSDIYRLRAPTVSGSDTCR